MKISVFTPKQWKVANWVEITEYKIFSVPIGNPPLTRLESSSFEQ